MTGQQTTVAYQDFARPGTLADLSDKYARSYSNEEASTEMPFGVLVKLGTDPDVQVKLVTAASAATAAGITMLEETAARTIQLGDHGIKYGKDVSVLRRGVIRVYCSEAVVVGTSAVRIRIDTNAGTGELLGPGTFCVSASSGHTELVTSGMKWVKGCGAGGVAELEVNMTSFAITAD